MVNASRLISIAIVIIATAWSLAVEAPNTGGYVSSVVIVKDGDFDVNSEPLVRLNKLIGISNIGSEKENPACCIWVQKIHDKTLRGKFTLIFAEGVVVFASDDSGIDNLCSALEKRKKGEAVFLPRGILTNIPLIVESESGSQKSGGAGSVLER